MNTLKLTEKQKNVLKTIEEFINKKGYSPTIRELGILLGLKFTSTVKGYIDRLVEGGYVKREEDCPRTLRVVNRSI
jgi:SOS-response transcriptional repressors (RecA-mediated autopeptidases)